MLCKVIRAIEVVTAVPSVDTVVEIGCDFKFYCVNYKVERLPEMRRHVVWKECSNISEELAASIFRVVCR